MILRVPCYQNYTNCSIPLNKLVIIIVSNSTLKRLQSFSKRWERSGSVVECLTRDGETAGFEPHHCNCVVVLEQDTFILA